MRIYGRVARVTLIGQPTGFIGSNPQFFENVGNAIVITEARISGKIEKHLNKEPNICELTVYNLAPDTRREVETGKLTVIVELGHDNVYRRAFVGDRRYAFSKLSDDGTTWETKITVGDGSRAYAHAFTSRSYKPPIAVRKVMQDLAATMNLQLPQDIDQSLELRQALADGISMHGPTRDVLTKLIAPYGYNWSIQNGRLQILKDGANNEGEALLINGESGLIGSPARSPINKNSLKQDVTFEVILKPELMPGNKVQLESSEISGMFRIQEVTDTFDTHDKPWKSAVKANPISEKKNV